MPPPGYYIPTYPAVYSAEFIAAFAAALLVALVGLAFDLASRQVGVRRAAACTALILVAVALAFSCWMVLHIRSLTLSDTITPLDVAERFPSSRACDRDRFLHGGYQEARANATLALWAAPVPLFLGTFVASRSLRGGISGALAWAAMPLLLLAIVAYLCGQPLPGRVLWASRCDFLLERDRIVSSTTIQEVRRGCYNLSEYLTHPKDLADALGTDSLSVVLPEFPTLQKRCMDDMLDETGGVDPSFSRRDVLNSPFLAPEARASVLKRLDEIAPLKPLEVDAGAQPYDK